ncbi:MAG: hypothetical protein K5911_00970 [Eubacteriales bacterium]|nr:hypothetical protein [Eubacteriales bacterium]
MKKIKRKYITVSAVLTAVSAGIAYLISGRWQAAAWSGGIVLTVMIVIALLVGALIQKGVDLAVDTAGNWLKKALVRLLAKRAEKAAAEAEADAGAAGEDTGAAGEDTGAAGEDSAEAKEPAQEG